MSFKQRFASCLERLYDYRGKASRREFGYVWLISFLITIMIMIPAISFIFYIGMVGSTFEFADELADAIFTPGMVATYFVWGLVALIAGTALTVANIFTSIRRLHDLKVSGWWWWLYLVPVVNFFFFVCLLFLPGKASDTAENGCNRQSDDRTADLH